MIINCALSAYPLSQSFRTNLEGIVGEPIHFFLLSELRQKKFWDLWLFLRKLRPQNLFLSLEDPHSNALLPILQLIGSVAAPKQMNIVDSNYEFLRIRWNDVFISCTKLIIATLVVQGAYWRILLTMRKFSDKPKIAQIKSINGSKKLLYLNANLWFGVKAGGSVGHIAGVVNALNKQRISGRLCCSR